MLPHRLTVWGGVRRSASATALMGALGLAAATLLVAAAPPSAIQAGTGTLYIGGWPNRIFIIDEATEKVTGEITTQTEAPPVRMDLSLDRKRFYTLTSKLEDVEIVDIASRRSIDQFRISENARQRVIIRSFTADPLNRFMVLLTKSATKQVDRFDVSPPELLLYDLKEHKVTRKIPWPKGEEREFANIMMSPDGKFLYFFSEDVLIYETDGFTQVDKWELSRPIEEGFGRLDFGPRDVTWEEPGYYTGLFFVKDPVQNREMMGIARVNLPAKSVDFQTIGPARRVSFSLAPDRKRAFGLLQEIGHYEFWTFDLEKRRLLDKKEFDGRPRMSLRTSSNGKVLYVYNAGNTIDLFEAATYKYLRRITLDADTTTDLFVFPPAAGVRPAAGR